MILKHKRLQKQPEGERWTQGHEDGHQKKGQG